MGLANTTEKFVKLRPEVARALFSLRREISRAREREASQRDKVLTAITAGGLVILSTFLVNFRAGELTGVKAFLWTMALFVISLIFTLVSYFTVDRYFAKREQELMDWAVHRSWDKLPKPNCWKITTDVLTLTSLMLTILGILLLTYFGYLNIARFVKT